MVRPVNFRMNEQTAVNNYFQEDPHLKNAEINKKAQDEFDQFVKVLREHGVDVITISDNLERDTPDSIFPNNWVSFHQNGTVCVYPMFAHTHTDRHTHTQTHTHRHTHRHRQTQTDTDRHRQTQTHRHTDTQTHRHTDTQTRRHTDTHTHNNLGGPQPSPLPCRLLGFSGSVHFTH